MSFAKALRLTRGEVESTSFEAQLDYWENRVLDTHRVHQVRDSRDGRLVGFMAQNGQEVGQLYLHPDIQRFGLGSRLIALAKRASPTGLELYTFEVNIGAQAFYAAQGFKIAERGYAELADNPWATHRDELADIRLEWRPAI